MTASGRSFRAEGVGMIGQMSDKRKTLDTHSTEHGSPGSELPRLLELAKGEGSRHGRHQTQKDDARHEKDETEVLFIHGGRSALHSQ